MQLCPGMLAHPVHRCPHASRALPVTCSQRCTQDLAHLHVGAQHYAPTHRHATLPPTAHHHTRAPHVPLQGPSTVWPTILCGQCSCVSLDTHAMRREHAALPLPFHTLLSTLPASPCLSPDCILWFQNMTLTCAFWDVTKGRAWRTSSG